MADSFREAISRLEQAMAGALETVTAVGTPAEIEKIVRLHNRQTIVTDMLLEKVVTLSAFDNFRQPDPTEEGVSSNRLNLWDQLVYPAKHETNAELETRRNPFRFFL